ncbi:Protein LURP-one-related 8 [Acorus calamus]|uniref:Protein LURP-one-related 8 n=1 Tax=Acorus calamus TaxID=4465 RepID=A0AAV9FPS6_ACOCL|nr:Protein LURP-one-related 8 [Acorus calamus]
MVEYVLGDNIEESCKPTSLTVWKKSLVYSCSGFSVIDHCGNLRYRVENYDGQRRMEDIVLMDAAGKPLLTMRRKKMSWHNSWLVLMEKWMITAR